MQSDGAVDKVLVRHEIGHLFVVCRESKTSFCHFVEHCVLIMLKYLRSVIFKLYLSCILKYDLVYFYLFISRAYKAQS